MGLFDQPNEPPGRPGIPGAGAPPKKASGFQSWNARRRDPVDRAERTDVALQGMAFLQGPMKGNGPEDTAFMRMQRAMMVPMALGVVASIIVYILYDRYVLDLQGLAGGLAVVIGLFTAIGAIGAEHYRGQWAAERRARRARSRLVTGEVVEIKDTGPPLNRKLPVVRFAVGGDERVLTMRSLVVGAAVGDTLQVRYDPTDHTWLDVAEESVAAQYGMQPYPRTVIWIALAFVVTGAVMVATADPAPPPPLKETAMVWVNWLLA